MGGVKLAPESTVGCASSVSTSPSSGDRGIESKLAQREHASRQHYSSMAGVS